MTINGISLIEDQEELVAKANAAIGESPGDGASYARRGSDNTWVPVAVGGGSTVAWVDIVGKPATFPPTLPIAQSDVINLTTSLAGKEATITAGVTTQYWRGDKAWATLDKAAAGLGNVDNTSDANKPVSTAQATAIAAKVSKTGDTMTGALAISPPSVGGALVLTKPAGVQNCVLSGYMGANPRWTVQLGTGVAESGGNAGSGFSIDRYSDAGAYLGSPLVIDRAAGNVAMAGSATVNGDIIGGQNFRAQGATALLATASAGTIILRPNGSASAAGQAYVASDGTLNVSGSFTCNGSLQSTQPSAILGGNGGAVYLRPYGVGNVTSEAYQDAAGSLHSTVFHPTGAAGGFRSRTGGVEVASADVFNFFWDGASLTAYVNSTVLGAISFVSDYRTKKDVADLPSTWEHVRALRPIKYTHADFAPVVADDVERWGFVAHELQETLVQSAATGVKDAPDEVQSPNPWTIIAALTRTVQEMQARIEALETKW